MCKGIDGLGLERITGFVKFFPGEIGRRGNGIFGRFKTRLTES